MLNSRKQDKKWGEFVDIFPFDEKNCCPVRALRELKIHGVFGNNSQMLVRITTHPVDF